MTRLRERPTASAVDGTQEFRRSVDRDVVPLSNVMSCHFILICIFHLCTLDIKKLILY